MKLEERIDVLDKLSAYIRSEVSSELTTVIAKAIIENPWFTEDSVRHALLSIADNYLSKEKVLSWLNDYDMKVADLDAPKKVGLVLAGNIPMVGLHDLLCVFLSGHHAVIKYSHKDKVLLSHLIKKIIEWRPEAREIFTEVERLQDIDAIIATGGDTAASHFASYFGKYPHIIRKKSRYMSIVMS